MFNNAQVEKVAKDLGLDFRWTNPPQGANYIVIEDTIEYSPFACKIRILKNGKVVENITSDTTRKYKELCEELAKNK